MRLFCRHSVYKVIACNVADRFYIVRCEKYGTQFKLPKAPGEDYKVGTIVHRQEVAYEQRVFEIETGFTLYRFWY